MIKRTFFDKNRSFFLFGPRGVGKSTWMKQQYQDAIWIDLLNPETLRNFLGHPERLFDLISANQTKNTVVIDEVQKIPALLSVIHSIIESNLTIKFILSGSSARKLKKFEADLLAGRALKRTLHPFTAYELGEEFSLTRALKYGMLPLVYHQQDAQEILQSYIALYLHEEIQAEGLIRNLEGFSRFLEAISFSHASLLNVNNVARECSVKRKTVENYLEILEDLLLCYQIPIFAKKSKRQLIAHKKFYLFDSGIFATLRPKGILDRPEETDGAALEGIVAQHLQAWNDYSDNKNQISFWRTRAGLEVDFIVYGDKKIWAIEVKNSRTITPNDLRGLQEFSKDYPMTKTILLYRGTEKITNKGILCLPCEEFLKNIIPNTDLPV